MEDHIQAMRKWLQTKNIAGASDEVVKGMYRFSILYAQKLVRQCVNDKAFSCKAKGEKMSKVTPRDIAMTYERMKHIQGAHITHITEQRRKKLIKMINSQDLEIDRKNQTFLYMSNNIPHMLTKQQFQLGIDDSGKQINYIKKKTAIITQTELSQQKKIGDLGKGSSSLSNKSKSQKVSQQRKVDSKSKSKQKKNANFSQKINNTQILLHSSQQVQHVSFDSKKSQINNNCLALIDQHAKIVQPDYQLETNQVFPSADLAEIQVQNQQKYPSEKVNQGKNNNEDLIVISSSQYQHSQSVQNTIFVDQKQVQIYPPSKLAPVQQQSPDRQNMKKSEAYQKLAIKSPRIIQIINKQLEKRQKSQNQAIIEQNNPKSTQKYLDLQGPQCKQVLSQQSQDTLKIYNSKDAHQIIQLKEEKPKSLLLLSQSSSPSLELMEQEQKTSSSSISNSGKGSQKNMPKMIQSQPKDSHKYFVIEQQRFQNNNTSEFYQFFELNRNSQKPGTYEQIQAKFRLQTEQK